MADDDDSDARGPRKTLPKLNGLKSPLGDVSEQLKGYKLPDLSLKILDDMKEMQKRLQGLAGIGNPASAAIREQLDRQQSLIDAINLPKPHLPSIADQLNHIEIPPNPIYETNDRLEEISARFDQMLEVMASASAVATRIQSDANTFLEKFDEASAKTDRSANKAVRIGMIAVGIAVLTPFIPLAINYFSPDPTVPAIETLTRELLAAREAESAATAQMLQEVRQGDQITSERLIEGIRQSDQATVERLAEELRQTREQNATLLRELQRMMVSKPQE
ncbi:hypothetical protein [Rhizobium halophilum]|uniref:hypothetical protein n=1 Tax=Rhizobium halophilum TaxID=2846852 RepID=UPI001EFDD91C|nr:hypothetical protein [Rhizobium halophilum]MCF6371267.1 hypothetical protein [Rhizobium halophilum]